MFEVWPRDGSEQGRGNGRAQDRASHGFLRADRTNGSGGV